MLTAFFKSLVHIWIWPIQRYLWLSFFGSLAFFVSFWYAGNILISSIILSNSWLEAIISMLGFASIALLTWFLFPVIMSAIIGICLENIQSSTSTSINLSFGLLSMSCTAFFTLSISYCYCSRITPSSQSRMEASSGYFHM